MTGIAVDSLSGAARATRLMAERGPQLQAATQQLERYETRLRDTVQLLEAPRAERLAHCSRPLYDACWNRSTEIHKQLGVGLAMGTLGLGAALGAAVSIGGHPQLAGLIALGSLVATFKAVPHAYAAVVKKWILPRQMDPLVTDGLSRERRDLESAVKQAAAYKQQVEREIEASLQAPAQPAPTIKVEEAYVLVGGVRIPVRS